MRRRHPQRVDQRASWHARDKRLRRIEGCDALMCEDTFAYVIILNGNSLQGMRHDSRSLTREHPVTSSD